MKGQTLLLADDSVTTHRVVELTFAEHGLRVVSVSDGQQAIEKLSTERPDIVLAAINMPKADGYEVARFIKSQPALQDVPVLLLRGAFDAVDDRRARESGAAGVLAKPIESTIVINRVKELLGMRAKAAPQPALAAGRLVTPAEPPPMRKPTGPRGVGAPASARPEPPAVARPDPTASYGGARAPATPAAARTESEASYPPSLARPSDASFGEASGAASPAADYFEKLDAAFDNLDAQLSGRPPGRGTAPAPVTPGEPDGSPVYEVDSGWFPKPAVATEPPEPPPVHGVESPPAPASARPESSASDPPSLARPSDASFGEASGAATSASARPESSPSDPPSLARPSDASFGEASGAATPVRPAHVADAFDAMLAAEQREGRLHHAPIEISDDVIERIASRVADRLSEGVLMDTIVHIVTGVTERMVREEIARIRAAAQAKKQ